MSDAGCRQCLSDQDCPAPLFCNPVEGQCIQCDATHLCPAGQVCDPNSSENYNGNNCIPDCRLDAGICMAQQSYCDFDSGVCFSGCHESSDCPASTQLCFGPPEVTVGDCVQCTAAFGCSTGMLCQGYEFSGFGDCLFDCRLDAGACRPGICNLTGASNQQFACWPGACLTSADCAASPEPLCGLAPDGGQRAGIGSCEQCLSDTDCAPLGLGQPICQTGLGCSDLCENVDGGLLSCGSQPCLYFDGGGIRTGDLCGCLTDADCAGQPNTPQCIPAYDGGIDAGAGMFGLCGCAVGGCAAGSVCETREDVLKIAVGQYVSYNLPVGACIPACTSGSPDCAQDPYEPQCNPATGYCVGCTAASQCPETMPACVPWNDVPGGAYCGCGGPSDCADGLACALPGVPLNATCIPPCAVTSDGYDSCLYDSYDYYQPRCNTETGVCQQCLTNADCVGRNQTIGLANYPLGLCTDGGSCIACYTNADCPASAPGCVGNLCGTCVTSADCPSSAAECISAILLSGRTNLCVPPCTVDGGECAGSSPNSVLRPDPGLLHPVRSEHRLPESERNLHERLLRVHAPLTD